MFIYIPPPSSSSRASFLLLRFRGPLPTHTRLRSTILPGLPARTAQFVLGIALLTPNAAPEKKLKFSFQIYDKDKRNKISPADLKELLVASLRENDVRFWLARDALLHRGLLGALTTHAV